MRTTKGLIVWTSATIFVLAQLGTSAARAQTIATVAGGGPANSPLSATLCVPISNIAGHGGNLYVAGCNQIYLVTPQGQVSVIARASVGGFSGDGGTATAAQLNNPKGVFVDSSGNVFISDTGNNRIREVVAATGNIKTIAGIGTAGFAGDGSAAMNAQFNSPQGICGDAAGDIFIADTGNVRIREITSNTQIIQTVAGNGTLAGGNGGDGGPATNAVFAFPEGVFVDASGNLYIADGHSSIIRKVTASTGIIQTIAGNPSAAAGFSGDGGLATKAQLFFPQSIFVDANGNIFIADAGNDRIREVVSATGNIQTVAGEGQDGDTGDGGLATSALLLSPGSIFVDSAGNAFIGDWAALREVVASTGNIQTVAANAGVGYSGDNGPATTAALFEPNGVTVDGTGNIFISDTANHRIREIDSSTGNIEAVVGNGMPPGVPDSSDGVGGPPDGAAIEPWELFIDALNNIVYTERPFYFGYTVGGTTLFPETTPFVVQQVTHTSNLVEDLPFNPMTFFPRIPTGVFVDSSENIFVADLQSVRVLEIVASTGVIQVVAGKSSVLGPTGDGGLATSASLGLEISGIFVDSTGNLYISAQNNIREVIAATGIIRTVAGSENGTAGFSGDGGPATSALLSSPGGLAVDRSGNIFIADLGNARIREVVASTGNIQTIAGTGVAGFSGDSGPANSAQINLPRALALDASGNLIFTDSMNSRIREIFLADNPQATLSSTVLNFPAQIVATKSASQSVAVTNNGNASLNITGAPSIVGASSGDFAIASGTTCTTGATVLPNNSCVVNISFTPVSTGSRGPATLSIADNASNTFPISLTGSGVDFSIGPQTRGSTSATVSAGQTANFNLQVAPVGFTGTVSLTCTGAPLAALCSISSPSVIVNGSAASPFTVTVTTTARGVAPVRPTSNNNPPPLTTYLVVGALGTLIILSKSSSRNLRPSFVLTSIVMIAGILVVSCGYQTAGTTQVVTGTPAGTSTLTVTATSGSASRTASLALMVN